MVESDFYAVLGALIAAPVRSICGGEGFLHPCTAHAIYRIQRRLRPTVNHLASAGRQNLVTRFGLVDLAGTVGRDPGYPELLTHSRWTLARRPVSA